jgi:hypothetical protein
MVAANVVTRAIARGVFEATALPFSDSLPAWKDRFFHNGCDSTVMGLSSFWGAP